MKREVTANNYAREVLAAEFPVLVEFYAKWCPKCAMMEDVLTELARENENVIKVCQIDIDESKNLAAEYQVEIVPTYVVFAQGVPLAMSSGVKDLQSLREMIQRTLETSS